MKSYNCRLLQAIVILLVYSTSFAQDVPKKAKIYNVSILTIAKPGKVQGLLYEVKDSSIVVITKKLHLSVPASAIQSMNIKRKAAVGRGAMAGGLTGLSLGLIIGLASGDDECPQGSWCIMQATAEEKALGGGLVLSGAGALIGVIVGSVSRAEKIVINGDLKVFRDNLATMKKYAGGVSPNEIKSK